MPNFTLTPFPLPRKTIKNDERVSLTMLPIAAVMPLSILGDLGETIGELGFVLRLMAFVYILFWLFATFQDNQLLFGFTALIAAYFTIFYAPVIVVLASVVLLMVNGMFIQQSLMFGLFPALGRDQHGSPIDYPQQMEQMKSQELHSQLNAGRQISEKDMQFLAQMQQRQEIAQAQVAQAMQGMGQPGSQPQGGFGFGQPQPNQLSDNLESMQVGMRRMR